MASTTIGTGTYAETWEQSSGDVDAAGESSEFTMVRADNQEIRIVEIVNVCSSTGEPSCTQAAQYGTQGIRDGEHYWVDEFTFDYNTEKGEIDNVDLDEARRAVSSIGMPLPYGGHGLTWELLRRDYTAVEIAQACFRSGSHRDPRQPDCWADEHGASFPTLKAAMDAEGIPQAALWRPDEYERTWSHEDM